MEKVNEVKISVFESCLKSGSLFINSNNKYATLLVFIPGWTLRPIDFYDLLNALVCDSRSENILYGADLFPFSYSNSYLSNANPEDIAAQLALSINKACQKNRYSRIFIMGHSIGALLARRTVLLAKEKEYAWVDLLNRMVLLAGTNRGFVPYNSMFSFFALIVPVFRVAKLIMSMQIGSVWVTSLRMKWIKTYCYGKIKGPEIVQIYGDQDAVVSEDDAIDINRFDVSVIDVIRGADHKSFCKMKNGVDGYEQVLNSFIRGDCEQNTNRFLKPREKIIFLIHGIRDFAEWHHALEYEIEKKDRNIDVIPVQYGYFNLLQFLLPHQQKRAVRVFVDKYVQEVSLSPDAEVFVAAHSNGTLVFQQAVEKNDFIKVERVFFAGSVVNQNVKWNEFPYKGRVKYLRNVCANKDVPVGFLCKALHEIPFPFMKNFGTGGYKGFVSVEKSIQNCFISGGHGSALKSKSRRQLVEYMLCDEEELQRNRNCFDKPLKNPWWLSVLSRLAFFILFILFIIMIIVFCVLIPAIHPPWIAVVSGASMAIMLLWMLQKI